MNYRGIGFRLLALTLAAMILPSCGGSTEVRSEGGGAGEILKISYYRVNPEPKTKRPEPTYRVLMSRSWQDRVGESPREPFPKAAPNQVYKGFDEDVVVRRFVDKLRGMGLDQLASRNPDEANPQDLYAFAMNPANGNLARIITVGSDRSARSYWAKDQSQGSQSEIYIKCEMYVMSVMAGSTIKVQIVTDPREKQ